MPKTWLGWAFLILVGVWVIHNPAHAGATVNHWFNSALTFVSNLTG